MCVTKQGNASKIDVVLTNNPQINSNNCNFKFKCQVMFTISLQFSSERNNVNSRIQKL